MCHTPWGHKDSDMTEFSDSTEKSGTHLCSPQKAKVKHVFHGNVT